MYFTKNSSISNSHEHILHVLDFLNASPFALGLLGAYGFDEARLSEGRALLAQAKNVYDQVKELQRSQKAATLAFHTYRREMRSTNLVHLNAARRALGTDAKAILTASPSRYLNWLTHSRDFYTAVLSNPGYQEKLRSRSIQLEALIEASQKIEMVVAQKKLQSQQVQNLRLARQESQQKQRLLKRWFKELSVIATLAFNQYPSLLALLQPISQPVSRQSESVTVASVAPVASVSPVAPVAPIIPATLVAPVGQVVPAATRVV